MMITLRELIRENNALPLEKRRTKYDLLVSAGYPETKARALADILVEDNNFKIINNRGFDVESAKLVVQEIAHDTSIKPEVRLKAAEDIFKVHGLFKEGPESNDKASAILAQLLSDMFHRSESRPKIVETKEIN